MHDFLEGLLISEMKKAGRLDGSNVFPLQWFLTWNYAPVILWRQRWRREVVLRMN